MSNEHVDVLILGAGLSGIGMACYLKNECPDRTFAIIERRASIGGTWDLFRYPGVRSDSDMATFGYKIRPWTSPNIFADGTSIRDYIRGMSADHNVDDKIKYGLKTTKIDWSSENNQWTVYALDEQHGEEKVFTCNFVVGAMGYYDYDKGHQPDFAGTEDFKGQLIHPQEWPSDLDYHGKKVVVIGSGATAVTLLPAMADDVDHITMLQRSPSYVFSLPGIDFTAKPLSKILPQKWVYQWSRGRNLWVTRQIYKLSRRFPDKARSFFMWRVRMGLGRQYDMKNFSPKYMPWDERLCMIPDGNLLKSIRSGKASVVTDEIEKFTETGIALKSGKTLDADIIVTATGLELQRFGGVDIFVDGQPNPVSDNLTYKAALLQNTPNLAVILGYTNISWTLRAEMVIQFVCRLLNEMDERRVAAVIPRAPEDQLADDTIFGDMQSNYVLRNAHMLPKQGRSHPWRMEQNYESDRVMYRDDVYDPDGLEWIAASPDPAAQSQNAA